MILPDREDKRYMWNASLFKERLSDARQAETQVEFWLGSKQITVRRGMDSESIRGVKIGENEWVNSNAAPQVFIQTVVEEGGYKGIDDFRYLVHRLCYLPESRQNIVWHAEAQLRIFLLLCADRDTEKTIQQSALRLKDFYNEMRHVAVSLGNLRKSLKRIESTELMVPVLSDKVTEVRFEERQNIEVISSELVDINSQISEYLSILEEKRNELQRLSVDIETNEIQLAESEEQFVLQRLRNFEESRTALALHKLLVMKGCPYCAQDNDELANEALLRIRAGLCPICGLEHIGIQPLPDLSSAKQYLLNAELRRTELLFETESLQKSISDLRHRDATLRSKAASLEFRLPRVTGREKTIILDDAENLRSQIQVYQNELDRWTRLHDDLKADIEQAYSEIVINHARSFSLIEERALKYASAFLGTNCVFTRTRSGLVDRNIRFDFPVLVPHFNDKDRTHSRQCSESQAFFLDIAFRIALIEVAQQLSGYSATFICETPENTLDLAYAENVAEMFADFGKAKGFSMMTANLQLGGIAEPLLSSVGSSAERRRRILNLLEYAELTQVQVKKRSKLDSQIVTLLED